MNMCLLLFPILSGAHVIHVNVSNSISFLNTSYVTYVRERIGDVTITANYNNDVIGNGSDVVEVGRSVRFVASVDSGMKLRYRWRFGDHRTSSMKWVKCADFIAYLYIFGLE